MVRVKGSEGSAQPRCDGWARNPWDPRDAVSFDLTFTLLTATGIYQARLMCE